MSNQSKKQPRPILLEIHGEEKKENVMEWGSINTKDKLKLTETEKERANEGRSRTINVQKFEQVKDLLIKGWNINQIFKETGIARSTIYKYMSFLDEEAKKAIEKIHKKYTKNTLNNSYSFLGLSIHGGYDLNTTLFLKGVVILLFLVGVVVLYRKYKASKRRYKEWQSERDKLYGFYLDAINYKYRKDPIYCQSKKEAAHFRTLCRLYGNSKREVVHLQYYLAELPNDYDIRRTNQREEYYRSNAIQIKRADERATKAIAELRKKGHLDFFTWQPWEPSFWASKIKLYELTEILRQRPHPLHGNYPPDGTKLKIDLEWEARHGNQTPEEIEEKEKGFETVE